MMHLYKEQFSDLYYLQTKAIPSLGKKNLSLLTTILDFFNYTANPYFTNIF